MPGLSHHQALPALSDAQVELETRLRAHVERLAEHIGERNVFRHEALERAAQYIEDLFTSAGHRPESEVFHVYGQPVRNIEIVLGGEEPSLGGVLIGAHYDSVQGSPGANDNGTGVAALLELARALHRRQLRRTVRLVAFVNEEPPFYYSDDMGSLRYAKGMAARGVVLSAMLSLETIGHYLDDPGSQRYPFPLSFFYPDTGNFIGFVGNLRSRALVRRVVQGFRRHTPFPSEGLAAPGGSPGSAGPITGRFGKLGCRRSW